MIFLIYFFITLKYNVYCLLRHLIGLFIVIPDKDIPNFLPHSQYEKIRGLPWKRTSHAFIRRRYSIQQPDSCIIMFVLQEYIGVQKSQ